MPSEIRSSLALGRYKPSASFAIGRRKVGWVGATVADSAGATLRRHDEVRCARLGMVKTRDDVADQEADTVLGMSSSNSIVEGSHFEARPDEGFPVQRRRSRYLACEFSHP